FEGHAGLPHPMPPRSHRATWSGPHRIRGNRVSSTDAVSRTSKGRRGCCRRVEVNDMTEGPVRMWRAIVWRASTVLMAGLLLTSVSTVALAQRASRPADEWMKVLDNPQRIAALKVDEVAAALKLAPGNIIADLGAGTGPVIPAFAQAVAPGGTVPA